VNVRDIEDREPSRFGKGRYGKRIIRSHHQMNSIEPHDGVAPIELVNSITLRYKTIRRPFLGPITGEKGFVCEHKQDVAA
jgi:hypothetical protein